MQKMYIEQLYPGMILGRSIYLADGKILCRKMTEISKAAINKFKELRLPAVYVASANDSAIPDPVSDTTRSDLARVLAKIDAGFRAGREAHITDCTYILNQMIDEVLTTQDPLPVVNDIRVLNDYISGHTVNVCVSAVKIGVIMGYDRPKLLELALAAFFHDIGMIKIPEELLNRVGGLTDEEIRLIQTHPKAGYDLVSRVGGIPKTAALVAYQHHERFNGRGYPKGLTGAETHEFAKIVAVADVFDAVTTEKLYRKAKTVPDTIQYLKSQKGQEYDPAAVDAIVRIYGLK